MQMTYENEILSKLDDILRAQESIAHFLMRQRELAMKARVDEKELVRDYMESIDEL